MRWGDVGQFGAHSDVGRIGVVFTPVLGPALKFTGMQGHDDWGDPIAHLEIDNTIEWLGNSFQVLISLFERILHITKHSARLY